MSISFHHAIVRTPGPNFGKGVTTADLGAPDYEKALLQHNHYCDALITRGITLTILDADPNYPDGCFVEDTAIITGRVAIITQPGHPARFGEQQQISEILSQRMHTENITGDGKVDGGDILRVGEHFYIGRSDRTNAEGARQLSSILQKYAYTSSEVAVADGLHLKSSVTSIGNNTLVATRLMSTFFSSNIIIDVGEEEYAANCVFVNGVLLFPAGFPNTGRKLVDAGYRLIELDMSEFRKMDGGLTCLSLLM